MPSHQQRSPGGSDDSYQGLVDLRFVVHTNNGEAQNFVYQTNLLGQRKYCLFFQIPDPNPDIKQLKLIHV